MARTKLSELPSPDPDTLTETLVELGVPLSGSASSLRRWLPSMLWQWGTEWVDEMEQREGLAPPVSSPPPAAETAHSSRHAVNTAERPQSASPPLPFTLPLPLNSAPEPPKTPIAQSHRPFYDPQLSMPKSACTVKHDEDASSRSSSASPGPPPFRSPFRAVPALPVSRAHPVLDLMANDGDLDDDDFPFQMPGSLPRTKRVQPGVPPTLRLQPATSPYALGTSLHSADLAALQRAFPLPPPPPGPRGSGAPSPDRLSQLSSLSELSSSNIKDSPDRPSKRQAKASVDSDDEVVVVSRPKRLFPAERPKAAGPPLGKKRTSKRVRTSSTAKDPAANDKKAGLRRSNRRTSTVDRYYPGCTGNVSDDDTITSDNFLRGDQYTQDKIYNKWHTNPNRSILASNCIDAGFKLRPTEVEFMTMRPEFNEIFHRYFRDKPDKPVMFSSIVSGAYADHSLLPPGKFMTMFSYLEYPASRGKIHIKSKNPHVEPFFDSGFMSNKADFAPIRWTYQKSREIARRMDAYRGELASHHPHFHPSSPAAAKDIDLVTAKQLLPNSLSAGIHMGTWSRPQEPHASRKPVKEDLVYSEDDIKAIDDWVADHVETTWHSLGTCAMKPRDQGGVVDNNLNVYGTKGLKIADLSICPENLGTNTYSSALLCGERCTQHTQAVRLRFPSMIPNEVDIIVAGGGPAGCATAGRIARADPNLHVLLLEGGASNYEDPSVYRPGVYVRNMQRIPENTKAKFYTDSMASSYLRGRKSIVPCANILGGGSSISFMMYTRASFSDWDDFNMDGWRGREDLLPLMKRLEDYQESCNNDTHGKGGPIAISNGCQITPLAQDYLRAAHEIGIPFTDDLQDCDTANGAEGWKKYINKFTGRRSDAAHAYIHPLRKLQKNLHLHCNARVSRVFFEGNATTSSPDTSSTA
ncbi:hypothetical protein JCM10207_007670 [Rhodosporidiobolus poonsookiae]